MKKRLCLAVLAGIMLISCFFSGCSKIENDSINEGLTDTSGYACIKIYGVKEESTTDEAIAAFEEAINKITLKESKTKVKLMFFTEDKYSDAINEVLEGLEELEKQKKKQKAEERAENTRLAKLKKENYEAWKKETLAKQEEAKRKAKEKAEAEAKLQAEAEAAGQEYIPEIEVPEYALDILLIRNTEELKKFNEEGLLKNLAESISLNYRKIAKYIHPTILGLGQLKRGGLLGITNNTFAGETQYAVFNTELYEKYKDNLSSLKNIGSLREYLEAIKANEEKVIPLLNSPEYAPGCDYIIDEKNPIGIYNPDIEDDGEYIISNIFEQNEIQAYYNNILLYRNSGFFTCDGDVKNPTWAVKFVTGDEYDKKELEAAGYTVMTFAAPRITNDNCNASFYGVYANTNNETRALDFIQLLNTNSEIQTLFAYGIEGVNYVLENGKVKMLNDTYSINKAYVGNRFIGYPTVDENEDIFEIARERNLNAVVSDFFGYQFQYDKEFIQEYTLKLVADNLSSVAIAVDPDDYKNYVTGSFVAEDEEAQNKADEYSKLLNNYCLNYATNGGFFMLSNYNPEIDGFYVGSTTRSKLDLETEMNKVVKANQIPKDLLELMKTVSEANNDDIADKLVESTEENGTNTYYAVAPIRANNKTVGIVCSITYIEDTMAKLEEILAEYWDDITTGIPDSSIERFAMKIVDSIESNNKKIENAKAKLKNAKTDAEKASAQKTLNSIPSKLTVVKNLVKDISTSDNVVEAYAKRLLGYYESYNSGKMTEKAYCAVVKTFMKKDFTKIWNIWDEIADMNSRFKDETNITYLLEILNDQYKN